MELKFTSKLSEAVIGRVLCGKSYASMTTMERAIDMAGLNDNRYFVVVSHDRFMPVFIMSKTSDNRFAPHACGFILIG